jgi:hypothetical protein
MKERKELPLGAQLFWQRLDLHRLCDEHVAEFQDLK